jgi:hypothetical protein
MIIINLNQRIGESAVREKFSNSTNMLVAISFSIILHVSRRPRENMAPKMAAAETEFVRRKRCKSSQDLVALTKRDVSFVVNTIYFGNNFV